MRVEYVNRIATHQATLERLLSATPLKYSDWPPVDVGSIRDAAGVYHFYEPNDAHIDSVYVKGWFRCGNRLEPVSTTKSALPTFAKIRVARQSLRGDESIA